MFNFDLPGKGDYNDLAHFRFLQDTAFVICFFESLEPPIKLDWGPFGIKMTKEGGTREYYNLRTTMTDTRISIMSSKFSPMQLHSIALALKEVAPSLKQLIEGLHKIGLLRSDELPRLSKSEMKSIWKRVYKHQDLLLSPTLCQSICRLDVSLQRVGALPTASVELYRCIKDAFLTHFYTMDAFVRYFMGVTEKLEERSTRGDKKGMKLILIDLAEYMPVFGWSNVSKVQTELRHLALLALLDGSAYSAKAEFYFKCVDILKFKGLQYGLDVSRFHLIGLGRKGSLEKRIQAEGDEFFFILRRLTMGIIAAKNSLEAFKMFESFHNQLNEYHLKGHPKLVTGNLNLTIDKPIRPVETPAIQLITAAMAIYFITNSDGE